jgi:4-amino-4-deoxy-L-arabinose transferase-like glycosyltransferase
MPGVVAIVLTQLVALAALAVTSYVFGRETLAGTAFDTRSERTVFSVALGMGLAGTVVFLIGLAGGLHAPLIFLLLAAGHVACFRTWRTVAAEIREVPPAATAAVVAALALPAFLLSLYPPSAFDETLYHLPYVRLFVREHAVVFAETLRFPVFPQLAHMLFTVLFMIFGAVSTHLVQLLAMIVTTVGIRAWSGWLEGGRAGYWAAAVWAGNPIVIWFAATSYVDLVLAMFVLLSARALHLWDERGEPRHLLLAAACAGFSASTKYHGLVFVLAFAVVVLASRRRSVRAVVSFATVAVLTLSPFYVRNVAVTGNPVFPFFRGVFGSSGWNAVSQHRLQISERLENLVELPLEIVADPERRHRQPPYSPFLLLTAPAALYYAVRRRSLAVLTAVMLGYVGLVSSADVRFLIPAAAFLCVLGGAGMARIGGDCCRRPRRWRWRSFSLRPARHTPSSSSGSEGRFR